MISKILELSTCHIEQKDMELLNTEKDFSIGGYEYGAFFMVPTEFENSNYSQSFFKLLDHARKNNYRFICLDCDADQLDDKNLNINNW